MQLDMSRGTDAHRVITAHFRGTPQRPTSAAHGTYFRDSTEWHTFGALTEEKRKMASNNRWESCDQNGSDCIKK